MARDSLSLTASCETPQSCPVVGACACGARVAGAVPCLDVGQAHQRKLELCLAAEAIADALPANVDRLGCLQIAGELLPLLRESHRYEEDIVFPAFENASARGRATRAATIRRLEAEHVEDECAAEHLTDVLLAIGHGGAVENPEALGFMLRAFFATTRRHIAFEREHVLPIVAKLNGVSGGSRP